MPLPLRSPSAVAAALLLGVGCAHAPSAPLPEPGQLRISCRGEAEQAWLLGSFNGWERPGLPLGREGPAFVGVVRPPPGLVQVACLLRLPGGSELLEAPLNARLRADDGFGGFNGVFEVPAPTAPGPRNLAAERSSLD